MVFTAMLMFYNTEWRYDHGIAINYRGKKFITLGPGDKIMNIFLILGSHKNLIE
jgi:hypothetical protein